MQVPLCQPGCVDLLVSQSYLPYAISAAWSKLHGFYTNFESALTGSCTNTVLCCAVLCRSLAAANPSWSCCRPRDSPSRQSQQGYAATPARSAASCCCCRGRRADAAVQTVHEQAQQLTHVCQGRAFRNLAAGLDVPALEVQMMSRVTFDCVTAILSLHVCKGADVCYT